MSEFGAFYESRIGSSYFLFNSSYFLVLTSYHQNNN